MNDPSRVEKVFLTALEKGSPEERAAYLDSACQSDPELRGRVERLLAAHPKAGGFLEPPARPTPEATVAHVPAEEQAGTLIAGRYKLLELVGEGGMGAVWVAEQMQPVRRKVALKLIKAGMDSKAVLARFEAERQALALMDHPNIARVFDGGVTDRGRPFFVMEYVKSVALTQYCDDNCLTIEERLALFVPVCQAVQHAHQKGIIHRDLKPSNVLVCLYDGKPTPKVIDFGLAKAMHQPLTEHTLHTAHGAVLGTPLYMSPEQAEFNNLDVDTRTDIYSLGVLLYELLTGTTPLEKLRFQEAAWQEMLRLIKEEEPQRPSTRVSSTAAAPNVAAQRQLEPVRLSRLLRGELDWIVLKALEKDRARRYATASDFAEDIERLLRRDVVLARPPSASYRLGKFVGRYRGAVAAAAVLLLLLLLGVAGTTLGMLRAWRAEAYTARTLEDVQREQVKTQAALEQVTEQRKKTQAALHAQTVARQAAEQSDRQARWHLYKARQYPFMDAWRDRDFGRLEVLLAESTPAAREPDFRGWEWYYFQDQCRQASTPHPGTAAYNGIAAVCRKTGQIAAATTATMIDLWASGATRVERTVSVPYGPVRKIQWSPTGDRVACLYGQAPRTEPAKIRIWNVRTGGILHDTDPVYERGPTCFAWHPSGQRLAIGLWSNPAVHVWDLQAARVVQTVTPTTSGSFALDWHPDGVRLAVGSRGGSGTVYDTKTGRTVFSDPDRIGKGVNFASTRCLRWSPDGKQLAVGIASQCVVYDETGTVVRAFQCAQLNDLSWSPDGRSLLAGDKDQLIDLWDVTTGKLVGKYRIHNAPVGAVGWSTDGKTFYSVSSVGGLRSSPARPPVEPTTRFKVDVAGSGIAEMVWSPDGRWFACVCGSGHLILDARTGQVRHRLNGGLNGVTLAWSPDSSQLITPAYWGKDETTVWDVNTGKPRKILTEFSGDRTQCVAWSPDGRRVAAAGFATVVWDAERWEKLKGRPKGGNNQAIAFSPDSRVVAAVGKLGLVLLDVASYRKIHQSNDPTSGGQAVSWSPDGKYVAVGLNDGSLHLHRGSDGARLHLARGHTARIAHVRWSPDGHRLATAGTEGVVMIWDAVTCDRLVLWPGAGAITGLAWSPDSRQLAAACRDGTIDVWGSPALEPTPVTATHLTPGVLEGS